MSKRIQELAAQAVEETQLLMIMEYRNFESKLYEKFAELIVRECLEKVHECVQTRITSRYYPDSDGRKIKQHFGIKE